MNIDPRTLSFLNIVSNVLLVIALLVQYQIHKSKALPGPGWWTFGTAAWALGFVFSSLRDNPGFLLLNIIISNGLFVMGLSCIHIGLSRFLGQREPRRLLLLFFSLSLLIGYYSTYIDDDLFFRRLTMSLLAMIISFLIVRMLLFHKDRLINTAANFLALVFVCHGIFFGWRAGVTLFGGTFGDTFSPSFIQIATYLGIFVFNTLWTFGFIILVNQRLNAENQEYKNNLHLIFNTSPDASLLIRLSDNILVSVNDGFTRLTEFTRAEVLNKPLAALPILSRADDYKKIINLSAKTIVGDNLELQLNSKQGRQWIGMISASRLSLRDVPHMISTFHDITERKQAENALVASRKQLREIINFLPDATLAIDHEKRVIIWNKAIEKMSGVSAAEMLGKGNHAYTIPFYGEARPQLMDLLFLTDTEIARRYPKITWEGDALTAEAFCPTLYDNRGAWVFAKASPLHDERGQVMGAIEIIRDITQQKQAEQALRDSETRHRSLFTDSPDAYLLMRDGVIVDCNRATEVLLRAERDQIVGKTPQAFSPEYQPDGQRSSKLAWEKTHNALCGNHSSFEWLHQRLDGECFFAEVSIAGIELNQTLFIFSVWRDISARKYAEAALRENQYFISDIIENNGALIYVKDRHGTYELVNKKWEETTGFTRDFVIGKTDMQLFPAAAAADLRANDIKTLEADTIQEMEEVFVDELGKRFFISIKFPIRGPLQEVKGICSISTEITERKWIEQTLRESKDKFKAIANYAASWEAWFSPEGSLLWMNSYSTEITGYTPHEYMDAEDFLGMAIFHEDRQLFAQKFQEAMQGSSGDNLELRCLRKDGSTFWASVSWRPILDVQGHSLGFRTSSQDISQRKRLEAELHQQATTDELTGAFNRRHFLHVARTEIKRAQRLGRPLTIALIDFDYFKRINDTYGHAAGDQALLTLTQMCQQHIREIDLFARFGGDEFVLLLPETQEEQGYLVVERIRCNLAQQPLDLGDAMTLITITSGIASLTSQTASLDTLLADADQALYYAKAAGRNQVMRKSLLKQ